MGDSATIWGRPLLVSLCAAASMLLSGSARAADRIDPIPATVGPPGGVGFYVNPTTTGLDTARAQAIIERSLARWGDTFLGLTSAVPGALDAMNVIGFASVPDNLLGYTQKSSSQGAVAVAATRTCTPAPRELSDSVRRENRVLRATLRRDVLRAGRVLRRTVRRKIRVPKFKRLRAPAIAQLCTTAAATSNPTVAREVDVLLRPSFLSDLWTLGPAFPTAVEYDFESVVLHELGHVSGLAHHVDDCDPSTPMPTALTYGSYWHAVDQWRLIGCPVPLPPAPAALVVSGGDSSEPLPGAGATALAGHGILINPRVPAGYDSARFVAVATRAVRRAGGTPLDVTSTPPTSGDGRSVLGFAPMASTILSSSTAVPREQLLQSYVVSSCRPSSVRLRRQVVVRKHVRQGGRRLRRDVIATRTRSVAGYRCTSKTRPTLPQAILPELDLSINELGIAWEFGPRLPTDGTRWDLETALLQSVMSAGGAPAGSACDTTTPNNSSSAEPGDWWRSTTEVSRSRCTSPPASTAAATRTLRGGARTVVHRAGGLLDDVRVRP